MNNPAIESLLKQVKELESERHKINQEMNKKIRDINSAIETLSGKKVWEVMSEYHYDDESPDYIKSSSVEE